MYPADLADFVSKFELSKRENKQKIKFFNQTLVHTRDSTNWNSETNTRRSKVEFLAWKAHVPPADDKEI